MKKILLIFLILLLISINFSKIINFNELNYRKNIYANNINYSNIYETIIIKLKIGSNIIYINDKSIIIDVPPQIIEGRTYLPIRWIAEPLGAQVKWDSDEKKVTISLNETIIELWIGKNIARVNDNFKLIDPDNPKIVPLIISGRTMLPIRFVAENLGCKVEWNSNIQTIIITYEKKTDDFYIEDIIAYSFAYPIDMQKVDSRMGFGIWYESLGITGYHLGVDLETEKPEYVKSIGDGYIKYVRLHEAKNDGNDYHAKVVIEHKLPDGRYICSVYYHLDETTLKDSIKNLFSRYDQDQEIVLKKPIKVEKGEVLGKTITILNQQKPHLHFGIRSNKFDSSIIRDILNGYYGYTKYTEVLAVWWSPEDFIETYKNGFKDLESITIKIKSDSVITSGPGLTYDQKGELTNYEQIAKAKKDQIFVAFEKKYKDGYYWYHIWLPSFYGTAQGWIRGDLVEEVEENIIEVIKEEGVNIKKFENEQIFDIYSKIYYKQSFVPIREFNNGYIFYTPDYYAVFRNGVRTYRENYPVNTYTAWVSKIDDNINFIERKKEILKKWENIGLNKKWVRSIDIDPFNPNIIYVATYGDGVFKSTDRGKTWNEKNYGIDYKVLSKILIDPINNNIIYTNYYKSLDGGNTWFNFQFDSKNNKFKLPSPYTLAIDPNNTYILYFGTTDGLYKSTDSATNFFKIGNGLQKDNYFTGIQEIKIDPINTNIIYVFVVYAPNFSGGVVFPEGIFKSYDGGFSFKKILDLKEESEYANSIVINPKNNNEIYVTTYKNIYKSIDGGKTWKKIVKDIIYSIILDYNQNILYGIGCLGEFYKSYDKGETWVKDDNIEKLNYDEIGAIMTINYDIINKIIYIGTYNGIYKLEL